MKKSTAPRAPKIKELDEVLVDLLKDYKSRHGLSNDDLGSRLGCNGTYVSRALNNVFEGDVEAFQAAARRLLDDEFNQRHKPEELCTKGFMVEAMSEFLNSVRVSKSIGVAHGEPGKGKSKALEVHRRNDPLCIVVTAEVGMGGWRGLRDAILAALPNKRRMRGETWAAWLVRNLKGSGRLLAIDNAELLTSGARKWVAFNWHASEKIDCPVALIGNEELMPQWSAIEKLKSRVGLSYELESEQTATDTAREMLRLHIPGSERDDEAVQLATKILKGGGACRAVEKHLLIAADLLDKRPDKYTTADAIRAANSMLLTDVKLAA